MLPFLLEHTVICQNLNFNFPKVVQQHAGRLLGCVKWFYWKFNNVSSGEIILKMVKI